MAEYSPEQYIRRALQLASRARRAVLPNPIVGSVIVHDNEIIGEGYHESFGGPHAEVNAIRAVQNPELLTQATLYVTLEPCSHTGKTPPCVDLIIKSKIPRVIIGCLDPYPQVAGRGIAALREAGVAVTEGILHDDCVLANSRFILAHRIQRPYVILKWAQSSDGFIAPADGQRVQISSPQSQQLLHYWRGQEMAIAVGSTTARRDNPLLTARHLELYQDNELPPKQPTRVVIGNATRLPSGLSLWSAPTPTMIFIPYDCSPPTQDETVTTHYYHKDQSLLPQICRTLYDNQILSLIVEGGAVTLQHLLDTDLWDEIRVFTAPIKLGSGTRAPHITGPATIANTSGADALQIYTHPSLAERLGVHRASVKPLAESAANPRQGVNYTPAR
jgi:diaminohydroxyphosphoribosylaminopyrimidine deaminase/5-amino-6-(5-phosphoribosylamino)uracil reductase